MERKRRKTENTGTEKRAYAAWDGEYKIELRQIPRHGHPCKSNE